MEGWNPFLKLCMNASSVEELNEILDLFLTIEEKKTLSSRTVIIKELLEDSLSQRVIAEKYHVSIAQITRGSNALKRSSPSFISFLRKNLSKWWR